jgi:hypothetical protein
MRGGCVSLAPGKHGSLVGLSHWTDRPAARADARALMMRTRQAVKQTLEAVQRGWQRRSARTRCFKRRVLQHSIWLARALPLAQRRLRGRRAISVVPQVLCRAAFGVWLAWRKREERTRS